MATLSERLYAFLSTQSELAALVGDRIYPVIGADKAATPYIVFKTISNSTDYTLEGSVGQGKKVIQISVFSEDIVEAEKIANILEDVMDTWHETEPTVQGITKQNAVQLYEQETKTFHIAVDFGAYAEN